MSSKLEKALQKAKKERETRRRRQSGPAFNRVEEQAKASARDATPEKEGLENAAAGKKGPDKKVVCYGRSQRRPLDLKTALDNRCICLAENSDEIEFYKILRTQIQLRTRDKGLNTIMVTSPQPGDGKTLTAINLAITMAREFDQTALLVDADLRRQKIHRYLGIESDRGLVNYLVEDCPVPELISWPGIDNLTVISGGGLIQETAELLGSPRMKALVKEMKARYEDRYVLFDTPPVLSGADALAFAPLVDTILVVVEAGKTTKTDIKKALELIPKEKVIGFVMNRYKTQMQSYYKYTM